MLDVLVVEGRPLPRAALFEASKAFTTYRQRGGIKTGVLPDFSSARTRRSKVRRC